MKRQKMNGLGTPLHKMAQKQLKGGSPIQILPSANVQIISICGYAYINHPGAKILATMELTCDNFCSLMASGLTHLCSL